MASRRRFLQFAGGLVVPAVASCLGLVRSSAGEPVEGAWPEHGGDAANTGHTTDRGPVDDVAVRWSYDVDHGVEKTPTVADGRVYVGGRGRMVALDTASGQREWSVDLADDSRQNDSAAAVADDVVCVVFRDTLYALDASDGSERWARTIEDSLSAPTIVGDTVYATIERTGTIKAFSVGDGSGQWTASTHRPTTGTPAVVDGTVYLTSGGVTGTELLVALDAADGRDLWTVEIAATGEDDGLTTAPAVHDGRVYAGANDGAVHAVSADGGEQVWTFEPGTARLAELPRPWRDRDPPPARVRGGLAVGDGTVYVAHGDGRLYALDAATGDPRWSFRAWNRFEAGPSVGDAAVYVGNRDTFVYALDRATGERLWEVSTSDGIRGSAPAIADGHVFVGSRDGHVYALWEGAS